MSTPSPSLRTRAALAVALTIAFYTMAIVIAAGLIAAPIGVFAATDHGNVWLTLALVGAGIAILRAIIPPRDRFDAPGPELTRDAHSELHSILDDVAAKAQAEPAHRVYLDIALNASVLEHRGERIMVLGLPLLATLDAGELQAVIAHEYGHFVAGDTTFGRRIWRTRVAALRTAHELATSESTFRRAIVRWPFEGYARLFLRITNAISRRAEFGADQLSARATSPEIAGRALRRISALDPAYDVYWREDVAPVLEGHRRPPLALGFVAMARSRTLIAQLDGLLAADLQEAEANPYASHPTLRQRLEALGQPAEGSAPPPVEHPALERLTGVDELERELLAGRFGDEIRAFEPIAWDSAGEIHAGRMQGFVQGFAPVLAQSKIANAADAVAYRDRLRPQIRECLPESDQLARDQELDALTIELFAAAVILAAERAGASLTAAPGEPTLVHLAGSTLDARTTLAQIATGERPVDSWLEDPVVAQIAETPLAPPPDEPAGTAEAVTPVAATDAT